MLQAAKASAYRPWKLTDVGAVSGRLCSEAVVQSIRITRSIQAAFGGEADVKNAGNHEFEGPESATSGPSAALENPATGAGSLLVVLATELSRRNDLVLTSEPLPDGFHRFDELLLITGRHLATGHEPVQAVDEAL